MKNPNSLGPWAYANLNPARYVDRDGRTPLLFGAIGFATGFIGGCAYAAYNAKEGEGVSACLDTGLKAGALLGLAGLTMGASIAAEGGAVAGLSAWGARAAIGATADLAFQRAQQLTGVKKDDIDVGSLFVAGILGGSAPVSGTAGKITAGGFGVAGLYFGGRQRAEGLAHNDSGEETMGWLTMSLGLLGVAHAYGPPEPLRAALPAGTAEAPPVLEVPATRNDAIYDAAAARAPRAPSPAVETPPTARTIPLGFRDDPAKFRRFSSRIHEGLEQAGYPDTEVTFQGSSVTGSSYRTGEPFDVGRVSDFDIALSGESITSASRALGIPLTGPLDAYAIEALGLGDMWRSLSLAVRRPVNFKVFESAARANAAGPGIVAPP